LSITKTKKYKYKSPSTEEFCTAQQYVVELLMSREAKKNGKSLPLKFWNLDEYKKKYKITLFRANALVKAYSEDSLVLAVCKNSWLYSLFFPRIDELIEECEKTLNSEIKMTKKLDKIQNFEEDTLSFRQNVSNSKNMKSRLDE